MLFEDKGASLQLEVENDTVLLALLTRKVTRVGLIIEITEATAPSTYPMGIAFKLLCSSSNAVVRSTAMF